MNYYYILIAIASVAFAALNVVHRQYGLTLNAWGVCVTTTAIVSPLLGYAYPKVSLINAVLMTNVILALGGFIAGYYIFGEQVTIVRIIGGVLAITGITLVMWK